MKRDGELDDRAGAEGVPNDIDLAPTAPPSALQVAVEKRVTRDADIDAEHIAVAASDGNVRLTGTVPTSHDRDAAGSEAFGVPGVTSVENDLAIEADGQAKR